MKKKLIFLILLTTLVFFSVMVVCGIILYKKGNYVLYTVTADVDGTPVELKDKYIGGSAYYEDYEADTVFNTGLAKRLNNGFRV